MDPLQPRRRRPRPGGDPERHGPDRRARVHHAAQRGLHHDEGGRLVRRHGQRGRQRHAAVREEPLPADEVRENKGEAFNDECSIVLGLYE